jgi:hypothetical protein
MLGMLELTNNQQKMLDFMVRIQYGYDQSGEVGYSDIMFYDFVAGLNWSQDVVKGILGSLIKKGYITYMDVNGEYNVYYVTEIVRKAYNMEEE